VIFKRRTKAPIALRLREAVAPRKGFWRGVGYIGKRMRRLADTPHRIALGFACGAVASFTPFFTLHFFLAAFLAWILRGNIIAGLFGTIVGNPFTFPLISTVSLGFGRWIMGRGQDGMSGFDAIMESFGSAVSALWDWTLGLFGGPAADLTGLYTFFDEVFLPYLIGGIVPGLICGAVFYFLLSRIIARSQEKRRVRLAAAKEARRRAFNEEMDAYVHHDGRDVDA